MRIIVVLALLGCAASCGGEQEPAATSGQVQQKSPAEPPEKPVETAAEKAPETPPQKPGEKVVEKPWTPPPPPKPVERAPDDLFKRHGSEAGQSRLGVTYACPVEGCTFTSARKETCIKHRDTMLKERWFVCPKCGKEEVSAGKCPECGVELEGILK